MRISRISNIALPDPWATTALLICLLIMLPIIGLAGLAMRPDAGVWTHLLQTVLPGQLRTTLGLMLGVGLTTALLGTLSAWLVTFCSFPLRRAFAVALLLPLSLPTYLAAYAYGDFLDTAGPVFGLWQKILPVSTYPAFASLSGAILVMSLVLYPYVFISARAAFVQQSAALIEAGRSLGQSPFRCFLTIALPMARPAIAVGVALALMECLNDIGAVEFLGVQTLTVGVYDTWLMRGSLAGAAQMALLLLMLMALLIAVERGQRPRGRYHPRSGRQRSLPRFELRPRGQLAALGFCSLIVVLGFGLPVALLVEQAQYASPDKNLWQAASNSLFLAVVAAGLTCLIGTILAYGGRSAIASLPRRLARFAVLGYAIPGTVLGLGVLIALTTIDRWSDGWLVLGGTLGGLLFAYVVRFLSLAFGTLESAMERVSPALDMAARGLGTRRSGVLWRIHLPLLRPALMAAMLIVFVDVMKELPATLILRPFDFETLASLTYAHASMGNLENAALPALAIIAVGLLPVGIGLAWLDRTRRSRGGAV